MNEEVKPIWLTAVMPVPIADSMYSRWSSGRSNGVSRTVSIRCGSTEDALREAAKLPKCAVWALES